MIEVEVKIPVGDLDIVRNLLQKVGEKKDSRIENDVYYSHPCRDFSVTDEAVRVRRMNTESTQLTYKGPKLSIKTKARLELNLQVANGDSINTILEKLGFKKVAAVTKNREWWRIGDTNVYLDNVEDLGFFVEIEHVVKEKENFRKTEDKVFRIMKMLCPDSDSTTRKSYLELILEKKRETDIS